MNGHNNFKATNGGGVGVGYDNQQQYYQSPPIMMAPFYQPNFTPNQQHIQVQPHDSQHQRLLQFQQRLIAQQQQQYNQRQQQQQQQLQQQQFNNNNFNNTPMSELEMMKFRQQQERQQLLANSGPNMPPTQVNQLKQPPPNQQPYNNHDSNNMNGNNNNAAFFQQYHLKNKQMSETSIPSTNADPLNSNSPTPPISSQRPPMNKNMNQQNGMKKNAENKPKPKANSQQDIYHKTPNNQFIQRSVDENPEGMLFFILRKNF